MLWWKGLEYRPVTDPLGLGRAAGFLPSSGALNSPVRTLLLLPCGLWGENADVFYTVQHSTAETPRMQCNGSKNLEWEDNICVQSQDKGAASTSPTLFSPRQGKRAAALDPCWLPPGCLMASAK